MRTVLQIEHQLANIISDIVGWASPEEVRQSEDFKGEFVLMNEEYDWLIDDIRAVFGVQLSDTHIELSDNIADLAFIIYGSRKLG